MTYSNDQESSQMQNPNLSPRDIESQTEKSNHQKIESILDKKNATQIDNKKLNESFKKTMLLIQRQLPKSSRFYSKYIHNSIVETFGGFIGKTIARPNSLLIGGLFAFLATLTIYTISLTMNYKLSGSETILAFATGWLAGIIYDYIKFLSRKK